MKLHITVALAVPVHTVRVFMTHVFSFGFGEHGRLGIGSEENASVPSRVDFNVPFHPLEISAGEQHTMVAGRGGKQKKMKISYVNERN